MKILIELRTAINVDDNNFLAISKGSSRIQQYVDGLKQFFNYTNKFKNCDIVFVDNTLSSEKQIPKEIYDVIPEGTFFYVKEKNDYGKWNKGAGDIEMWKDYSDILTSYDYFFHYEPRLILNNFSFFQSFLDNPRNYFSSEYHEQGFKTGYFGVNTKDFYEFYSQINLDDMVKNFISIEYIILSFFKEKKNCDITKESFCLWHDVAVGKYVDY